MARVTGTVDIPIPGTCTVSYEATYSSGNTGRQDRTVTVSPPTDPTPYCDGMTPAQLMASGRYNIINRMFSSESTIRGTNAADLIIAGGNGPAIEGRGGDDCIIGGAGDDQIWGLGGDDQIFGNGGDDILRGGPATTVYGGRRGRHHPRGRQQRHHVRWGRCRHHVRRGRHDWHGIDTSRLPAMLALCLLRIMPMSYADGFNHAWWVVVCGAMKADYLFMNLIIAIGCVPLISWWIECDDVLVGGPVTAYYDARCFDTSEYFEIIFGIALCLITLVSWLKYRGRI